jgi:hypothetical protein
VIEDCRARVDAQSSDDAGPCADDEPADDELADDELADDGDDSADEESDEDEEQAAARTPAPATRTARRERVMGRRWPDRAAAGSPAGDEPAHTSGMRAAAGDGGMLAGSTAAQREDRS